MKKVLSLIFFLAMLHAYAAHAAGTLTPYAHNNQITPTDSGYINNVAITGGSASTITWPTGAAYVNIACTAPPYYASQNSSIAVPNSTVTDGSGAALNPAQRQRSPNETTFYIIATSSQECSLEFWSLN